ncbi:MAG: phosphate signaling complex protein PhoU [Gaiella sp.]
MEAMRVEYQNNLHALEASLQELGEVTLRAVRGAVDALQSQDVELCNEVIAYDDEIDARYHGIEKTIEILIAQQAPVASDLRLILAVLHDSIHLERVGDQSVTIAKLTKLSAHLEQRRELIEGLREMGERAEEMVKIALDSLAHRDLERARSLHDLDELIDRTNRRVVEKVLAMTSSPEAAEWGMRMIVVARCIERIGDNAVDIGEQTAFLVTGEFHEFGDASH